jgi:AcrR family transcriptional regulator
LKVSLKPSTSESCHAATRQLLIEAAAQVFAQRGFKAASVREICTLAGANVAAVNYHFGDKDSLYAEVLKYSLRCAREKYPPDMGLGRDASWEERLRAFIHAFLLRIFDDGPQACHGQLLSREMIEPTKALDGLVDEEMRPMAHQLQTIIRGLLGPDASDEMVRRSGMSVISQIVFYHHCRPVTQRLFPRLQFTPKEINHLADHITEFSLAALKQMARNLRKK